MTMRLKFEKNRDYTENIGVFRVSSRWVKRGFKGYQNDADCFLLLISHYIPYKLKNHLPHHQAVTLKIFLFISR